MISVKRILSSCLIAVSLSAQAELREAANIAEALSDVRAGDLVVFDIDNTILEPVQTLGSDQWFEYRVGIHKSQGESDEQAIRGAIVEWLPVQKATSVQLVEDSTAERIKVLQDKGITVLALTARPDELRPATLSQLESVGVNIEVILFAFGKNKGQVLREYLQTIGLVPERLLFVDDKPKNVNNMDAEFLQDDFKNINFRYGAADSKVRAFSSKIAEAQWFYFQEYGEFISDAQAERL
jgi:hypothetical protein